MSFHTLSNGLPKESRFKGSRPQNIRRAILESALMSPHQQRGHQGYAAFHHFVYRPQYCESTSHTPADRGTGCPTTYQQSFKTSFFVHSSVPHIPGRVMFPLLPLLLGAEETVQQMTIWTLQIGRPGIIAPLSQVNQGNSPSTDTPYRNHALCSFLICGQGKMTRMCVTGSAASDSWAIWQK